jgi:uncharacterized protein with PIN domain
MENKFIADVHLGKLARLLRLLGFDTVYNNSFTATDLLTISKEQERILLSRNVLLAKVAGIKTFITTSEEPTTQLKQVVEHFELKKQFHPFSRCMVCNAPLQVVTKEKINNVLEKNTSMYFNEFWQCSNCRRIYWKGSHYERMLKTIENVIG